MCDSKEYFQSAAAADMVVSPHDDHTSKNKCINKRRFSDEQVKSLESMFETESKLEPRMKLKLARELDLKPRQVAIWFQNRRARWKSKQLERDYNVLKANYDALASQFEFEKKEKQSLLLQLQKLHNMLGTPQAQMRRQGMVFDGNSTDGDSDTGDTRYECEHKPSLMKGPEQRFEAISDDKDNRILDYSIQGEVDVTNSVELSENWGGFNSCDPFDQTCSSSQWWQLWS